MIHPMRLQKGDTIGVTAPAGPPDQEKLQRALAFFNELGLRVKLGRNIMKKLGFLAGTDEERLSDLHEMMADTKVKAIVFARGGYGTGRIADRIDYELIRQNPKIIWGYSDITYLHTAIRQQTGLITFHGPMLASDIGKNDFDPFSAQLFKQLFIPTQLDYTEVISPLKVYAPGEATGQLIGGNLSLLVSTLGTPYELETAGKLLLLEDIGEEPYRIDGMLNQLRLAGKLRDAAGVILADFAEADPTVNPSLTLEEVFMDYFSAFPGPVMSGFKIGHCFPHFSVPLGVNAKLSTAEKRLLIEPGVR
ncbi:S66 peptidase family protein [Oceanobacillus polygoni]|uniref:Muramoyltetrapeptide carboxypeptidase n=1 Tax=Oceanobacillus polygoni TaxID=1235259 RepID=A0A9X0YSI5_9BACI|nr:LD-carboxypeptidase [Oceanobacillus polygoni]MBP2076201.1 muramoyltetrapeptide carboxypeptidase [Oceanobacillus polygoni]